MEGAVFALTAVHLSPMARVINAVAAFRAAFADTGPPPGGEKYVEQIRSFFPLGVWYGYRVEQLTETQLMDVARALWELYQITARAYYERRP
jgi:hypothetical protein